MRRRKWKDNKVKRVGCRRVEREGGAAIVERKEGEEEEEEAEEERSG